ncbi:NAD binding domain of 6-phosphogluconate dehydrogenase-domain-containing protein [Aspergillus heterothallicus]
MTQIAWIGLGNIGKVLCENLARYGPSLTRVNAWNRTHSTAVELAAQVKNISAISSLADAVNEADIVCVCLSDDNAVQEVFNSIINEAYVKGKLFVDLSTIHPDTASAQSEKLQEVGAEYLGSPIFGGVPLARNRQVTLVLAGTSAAISSFRPFTVGVTCGHLICLSDKPCANAFMLKLIGNFIRFSAIATLGEADALSEVVGLPREALEQFVELVLQGAAVGQLHGLRAGEYHKTNKASLVINMNTYRSISPLIALVLSQKLR